MEPDEDILWPDYHDHDGFRLIVRVSRRAVLYRSPRHKHLQLAVHSGARGDTWRWAMIFDLEGKLQDASPRWGEWISREEFERAQEQAKILAPFL